MVSSRSLSQRASNFSLMMVAFAFSNVMELSAWVKEGERLSNHAKAADIQFYEVAACDPNMLGRLARCLGKVHSREEAQAM